jgi:hypothetical protein
MVSTEGGTTTNSIKSLTAQMPSKLKCHEDKQIALRFGHMIRRFEDLPQKALNPMEGEIREDRNPDGRMG